MQDDLHSPRGMMTDVFFKQSNALIDAEHGEGYARANPNLVAAFMLSTMLEVTSGRVLGYIKRLDDHYAEVSGADTIEPGEEQQSWTL